MENIRKREREPEPDSDSDSETEVKRRDHYFDPFPFYFSAPNDERILRLLPLDKRGIMDDDDEQLSLMNEELRDLDKEDIIGYPENASLLSPEAPNDLSLIVLMLSVHGNNPRTPTQIRLHEGCTLLKASAVPKGCVCINYTNTGTLDIFNRHLIEIIQKNRKFINDGKDQRELFEHICRNYSRVYLEVLKFIEETTSKKLGSSQKSTKRSNVTCIEEGKTDELFELTYGDRLYNKSYSLTRGETETKIIYDSRYPSVRKTTELHERFPFSTLHSSIDQSFSLQTIYDYFQRLGYRTIYIFDMSCDAGSIGYPKDWRGGKKNKKTYKRKKNKTLRRKIKRNKKKYTKRIKY